MAFVIILSLLLLCCLGVCCFLAQPSFGRNPSGDRLERIRRSPNYRDGMFRNQMSTPVMTNKKSRWQALWEFVLLTEKVSVLKQPFPLYRLIAANYPIRGI